MIQQKGIIRSGVSWFSSHIKRFFRRDDEEEGKRNHLENLYDRYERDSKVRSAKKNHNPAMQPCDKTEVLETVLRRLRNEPGLSQKYLARRKSTSLFESEIKDYVESRESFDKHNELVCPICMEYLVNPVPTSCGHTFCYRCLDNALLFKSLCAICRSPLRSQELSPCFAVNNIVKMHIRKSCRPEEIDQYELRLHDAEESDLQRQLHQSMLVIGERLDVRDTEYIWCRGFILNVYRKGELITEVLIHYQGWNKIYDEILEVSNPRLAPLGYYTNREDIPRYQHSENIETYYSYVQSRAIQVVTGPRQPPANENPAEEPEVEEAEEVEGAQMVEVEVVEQNEDPASAEHSASEHGQNDIELEANLNNRVEQANRIVRSFNVLMDQMQDRLMLRNVLNDMGLGNIGNLINLNDLGSGEQQLEPEQNAEALDLREVFFEQPVQIELEQEENVPLFAQVPQQQEQAPMPNDLLQVSQPIQQQQQVQVERSHLPLGSDNPELADQSLQRKPPSAQQLQQPTADNE